jgi:hypothetical protein
MTRIAAIDSNTVTIERSLPWDLNADYTPISLHAIRPRLANIGVEGINITMMPGQYAGTR